MNDKAASNNPLGLADPFAQLVRQVRDYAIFLLDVQGRIASWNAGAERIKGYAAAEVIGQHFSIFYAEEAKQRRVPDRELEVAARQGRFEDEGWRIRKDGGRFWANVIITALHGGEGDVRGFAKITRDLTERRREEEKLRRTQERFRLLVEGVKDYAIFMLDSAGRVMSWNAGAERINGYKASEIIGRHLSVFYPREALDKRWPEQELAMAREQGRFEDEGMRVRKDGSTFWANVTVTPLYEAGELVGYAKLTRDLTDRKRVEALERAERQTNEFLAMLAHELRNPLAPISNALDLLARKPTDDPTEQWARGVLQRQTGQMVRLVDDLLDVSRITRGAIALDRKTLDAREVLRTAFDASTPWMQARQHGAELRLPEEPITVFADEVRLSQVLQNLLHNAAQYTPAHGKIAVELRKDAGDALIRVKDSGIGMTPELLSSAFELFRQGQRALDRPQGGLGLGLSLVQRLVQMHGGSVQARSAGADQGSEFIVRLPLAKAPAESQPVAAKHESSPVPPRRVLVVDDNRDAAGALKLLLESDGHEVRIATDGVAGLAAAREYKPDYVLLDIGLPRLNGYDLAARLRADSQLKHVIIVAVTGYGQAHDRARTAAAGFHHHLVKPVDLSSLQEIFSAPR